MATLAVWLKIDAARVADEVESAWEKLHSSDGEVLLDFSAVGRVDAGAVSAMGKLLARADEKAVKIVLRGVNVEVYKVLKLVNLAPRFSFVTRTAEPGRQKTSPTMADPASRRIA